MRERSVKNALASTSALMCWTFSPLSVVSPTSRAFFCQSCGLMKNIAPVFVSPFSAAAAGSTILLEMSAGSLKPAVPSRM